jgi:hypothetical protein
MSGGDLSFPGLAEEPEAHVRRETGIFPCRHSEGFLEEVACKLGLEDLVELTGVRAGHGCPGLAV